MKYLKRIKKVLWFSISILAVQAITVLLMPFGVELSDKGHKAFLIITGILFWLTSAIGYFSLILANVMRKNIIRKRLDGDVSMECRSGIFTFFSNKPAVIADIVFMITAIILIVFAIIGTIDDGISFVVLAIMMYSLNMHCIFNGRIYKITKIKNLRREEKNV